MEALGIIVGVVGVALILVGRMVANSLPPNYQETEDDGFLQLLRGVGKMLAVPGGVFVVAGIIIFVWMMFA